MLRFITKHHFSYFDVAVQGAAAIAFSRGEWPMGLTLALAGATVSVILEEIAGK